MDSLQREQERVTESAKANVKQMEEVMRVKDEKLYALQMAASRAAQQLAEAYPLLFLLFIFILFSYSFILYYFFFYYNLF